MKTGRYTPAHRLLRKDGYSHVMQDKTFTENKIKVFVVHNSLNNSRLGMVVAKKYVPKASVRNLIKRIIREVFRQHNVKSKTLDMVVMVRRISFQEIKMLRSNLQSLFSKIEIRCERF